MQVFFSAISFNIAQFWYCNSYVLICWYFSLFFLDNNCEPRNQYQLCNVFCEDNNNKEKNWKKKMYALKHLNVQHKCSHLCTHHIKEILYMIHHK